MLIDAIKTGDRIDISLETSIALIDWTKAYVSRVEAVVNKNKILVHVPFAQGRPVRIPVGSGCTVRFSTERGILRFFVKVNEYLVEENFLLVSLKLTSEGEKIQRRDFFRFNCSIAILFFPLNENGETDEMFPKEGIVRDLGGGGMRMLSRNIISDGTMIRANLQLGSESIIVFGQVLRREELPNAMISNQYRIKFAAMSTLDQDKIIQYIYNQQRKNLQRS
ncbi:MAG: flagellar brake protein [Clostridiales bacterium]|jgi:c-di-GMP-binding flagellar brake protein YcgR|nr:flagellar brake protein [Clostridiales bacterium]